MDRQKSLIALSRCETSVAKKFKLYQERFWEFSQNEMRQALGENEFRKYSEFLSESSQKTFLDKLKKLGIDFVEYESEFYPHLLAEIDSPPIALYCKGNLDALKMQSISVVGSRMSTSYGREASTLFCKRLAEAGFCIVSGLAKGIDTSAHKSTLEIGGITIAVVANGVDMVYPAENKDLKEKIIASDGLIISEYPPNVLPKPFMFPERNRIIAGLSRGTLITEAGAKSGALITAYLAVDAGRDLFVVPNNITSKYGKGSNELIKKFNSAFVTLPEDILDYYNVDYVNSEDVQIEPQGEQIKIIEILEKGKTHFENIMSEAQMSFSELQNLLLEMEILGLIKRASGNYYEL